MEKLNLLQKLTNKLNYNRDNLDEYKSTHPLGILETLDDTDENDETIFSFLLWTKKFVYFFHCSYADINIIEVFSVPINPESANGYYFFKTYFNR